MQADEPIQNMTSYRNIVCPTQTLISFNKAKASDLAPKTRIALPFTVCKILKASSRKWLHFFFNPIAEDIFNHCFVSKGEGRGHFCESWPPSGNRTYRPPCRSGLGQATLQASGGGGGAVKARALQLRRGGGRGRG